ncbi:MAG: RNA pyrophosphohydrolase [Alphaproteobacteria bacterium GM7ARS4]|nr:RNA pyrophosphohydrolase [Alphaproteobacteria bacterium GM7ARS4]
MTLLSVGAENKKHPPSAYRLGVGMMVFNHQGHVFCGQRHDAKDDIWQMPQGGVDDNEHPLNAAVRELGEETGMASLVLLCESSRWYRYDLPSRLRGNVWNGRYRGQQQKWFAFHFVGDESEITLDAHAPAEFRAYKWASLDYLLQHVIDFKKTLYENVYGEFKHHKHLQKPPYCDAFSF